MVRQCPKLKAPCFLAECESVCKLERENHMAAFAKDGRPTRYLRCPCVLPGEPNACMDPECLKANECLDLKFGGQDMQAIAAINERASVKEHGAAAEAHECPQDKQPCSLLSCDGGKDCYAMRKKGGPAFTGTGTAEHTTALTKPGYTQYTPAKDCHTGMVCIGKIGGAEIFLGKEWDAKKWDQSVDGPIGMIIGLLGDPYPQGPAVGVNSQAKDIEGMDDLMYDVKPVPNIWIKWPDYGIVPFKRDWWHRLMNILDKVEGAVLIYCMGGHGRTGTCASIIATLGGLVPQGECPVTWLREVYCEKVVESDSQLAYIEAITGRKVTADCSKGWGTTTTHYNYKKDDKPTALVPWKDDEKKKSQSFHGGQGSSGEGNGHHKGRYGKGDPQRLSIKKWKQWWKRQAVATLYPHLVNVTRPKDLPDGQVFQIGKRAWEWNEAEHIFIEHKKGKQFNADGTRGPDWKGEGAK